jgi:acetolactate decarboxylase
MMPSPNIFYAFRIEGDFSLVRARSVPRQENYRPLVEVARDQPEFEYRDISGTLAGFFYSFFYGISKCSWSASPFSVQDRTRGGHLLSCEIKRVRAEIQFLYTMELSLP